MNKPTNSSHNNKRSRGRNSNSNSGRRPQSPGNRSFESNGPEVKVRGSASQICDKYLTLARDASSAGDRVRAESLLQHAEHYYRLVNGGDDARTDNANQSGGARRGRGPGEVAVAGEMEGDAQPQEQQQQRQEQPQEQRPSRRERASNAAVTGRGRGKAAASQNAEPKQGQEQEEATVEATVVEVIDASADVEETADEAVVIAEPVQVAEPSDEESAESEVA